ncbi:unnamed protein product, partial [Urochloa humidicola]
GDRDPGLLRYEDGTVVVSFDEECIDTTLTDSGDVVEWWLAETYRLHRRGHVAGLDVEWRPVLAQRSPVAVLQLCVGHRCLVFQILRADRIPAMLAAFLADPRFTFVGVGIHDDAAKLRAGYGLRVANAADLRRLAADAMGRPEPLRAGLQPAGAGVAGDGRADGEAVPRAHQRLGRARALG